MFENLDIASQKKQIESHVGKSLAERIVVEFKQNIQDFQQLESLAISAVDKGDLDSAVPLLQIAANHACVRHSGFFSSPTLEDGVGRLATTVRLKGVKHQPGASGLCHIATRVKTIGGHTKLIRRWIAQQPDIPQNLIITRQMGAPIPHELVVAVEKSGGRIIDIQNEASNLKYRLSLLVNIIERSLGVVLHTHPYDAFSQLAVHIAQDRPHVAFMNHADHTFWLGANTADQYIHFRSPGVDLSVRRRGLPREMCSILPIPMHQKDNAAVSKSVVRRELGLPEASVVALTIASAHKLTASGNIDFAEHHAYLASKYPEVIHLVIGPENDFRWQKAMRHSKGRLRALGVSTCIEKYFAAADFYIDSYPMESLTSLLEAGITGLPVISFDPWAGEGGIIHADVDVLETSRSKFRNKSSYDEAYENLARSSDVRREAGAYLAGEITEKYTGKNWKNSLDRIMQQVLGGTSGETRSAHSGTTSVELLDILLVLFETNRKQSAKNVDLLASGLPFKTKLELSSKYSFGSAGWLPERALTKLISINEKKLGRTS